MKRPKLSILVFAIAVLPILFLAVDASAQIQSSGEKTKPVMRAYGPGGPAPAMKEAAKIFGEKRGISIEVTAGPTPTWKDRAMQDADLIFSGSEYMMTDFIQKDLPDLIDKLTVHTLYLRPSAILVRPGNPRKINGINDLSKPGNKILVVQGAGQVGMWEDVAGRTGKIEVVDGVRNNIGAFAPNSGEAKKLWANDPSFDAWLIWTIWQKESPASADLVKTEPENTIFRSCGIAITNRSELKPLAKEFVDFLESAEAGEIFVKWGWMAR